MHENKTSGFLDIENSNVLYYRLVDRSLYLGALYSNMKWPKTNPSPF